MNRIKTKLPYLILILCAAALSIRAFYGFCWSDETFYISTTKRLFEGDLIFVDEWFPTQLSSVILLPFYALFYCIAGSTAGIILYFRLLYVILSLVIACISYYIIKNEYSNAAAISTALFMLLFAHLNIATMSYYTLSFQFFILAMLLLLRRSRIAYTAAGFIFALAVLCLPSLAVGYFAAMLFLVICSIYNKKIRTPLLWSFTGICAAAVIFLAWLYISGNSLQNIFRYLPYILSDEEHQTSLVAPFKKFFTSVSDVYGYSVYLIAPMSVAALFSGKLPRLRNIIFAADAVLFIYFMVISSGHTGYANTALALIALPLFCMNKKKAFLPFFSLYIGGLIFSMTYSYSSNGELYVMTIGHGIACVAAILFIDEFIRENTGLVKTAAITVLAAFLLQTCLLRFINIYRDAPLSRLTCSIAEGPASGLYTTEEHAGQYRAVLADIRANAAGSEKIFFSKLLPWGYLVTDAECAAPTTWRTKISSSRLEMYYSEHPDMIPDTVLIMNSNIGSYDSCGDIEADPSPNENELKGWFMDYMDSHGYVRTVTDQMVIYKNLP